MTEPRKTAAVYCRLSYAPDGNLEKVEDQEHAARQIAERMGWTVGDVYPDNNLSAWRRGVRRAQWERMLAAIEDGWHDSIIVYHGDRLIRQPWDLEMLLRLADERRLQLASVSGTRDLSSPDDRFVLRIEAAQACRESDNTSRRVRNSIAKKADQGMPHTGGARPYGFESDQVTLVPGEAANVAEWCGRYLAGESLHSITNDLNSRSVPTVKGKRWDHTTLRQVLRRPRNAGLLERKGEIVGEGAWPAIVDRTTWEAVTAQLQRRREQGMHGAVTNKPRYLLTGIAVCDGCKHTLGTAPGSRHRRTYACVNRDCQQRVHRDITHLDEYVIGATLKRLSDPRLADRLTAESDSGVEAELAALEAKRRQTAIDFADDPHMTPDLLRLTLSRLDARIAELRARAAATQTHRVLDGLAGIDRAGWDALPLDRCRAAVRELLTVTVLPSWRGPGFDPHGVRLD